MDAGGGGFSCYELAPPHVHRSTPFIYIYIYIYMFADGCFQAGNGLLGHGFGCLVEKLMLGFFYFFSCTF